MWLEDQALIEKIEKGEADYRSLMQNPENKTKAHVSLTSNQFEKPAYFQDKFTEIVNEIKVHNERNLKDKEYSLVKIQDCKERVDEAVD